MGSTACQGNARSKAGLTHRKVDRPYCLHLPYAASSFPGRSFGNPSAAKRNDSKLLWEETADETTFRGKRSGGLFDPTQLHRHGWHGRGGWGTGRWGDGRSRRGEASSVGRGSAVAMALGQDRPAGSRKKSFPDLSRKRWLRHRCLAGGPRPAERKNRLSLHSAP